uniref:Uncharacterized protein n=1 Tax=Tanacetum cinerariifolium TaxID=118510 RepID=A0A6L2MIY3_TANCI|nr:hypothetical protein [Tanacetum cinerariifolium]
MARMDAMTMKMDAQYKYFQSLSKQSNLDDDDIPISREKEAKFMQTFCDKYFVEDTGIEVKHFRDTLLQHMGNVKKSVAKRIPHQRHYDRRVNTRQMQKQESKTDTGKAVDADLVIKESSRT